LVLLAVRQHQRLYEGEFLDGFMFDPDTYVEAEGDTYRGTSPAPAGLTTPPARQGAPLTASPPAHSTTAARFPTGLATRALLDDCRR
jgi:hypothetical protein